MHLFQAGSISGGDSDELRSLLIKAGELLAPDKFSQTLTRPSQSPSSGLASQTSGGTLSHDTRAAIEEKGRRMASYSLAKEMVAEHLKVMDKQADKQRQDCFIGGLLHSLIYCTCLGVCQAFSMWSAGVMCGKTWPEQLVSKGCGMWPQPLLNSVWPMMMGDGRAQVSLCILLAQCEDDCSVFPVPKSESVVSERLSSPRLNQRSSMTLPHRTSSSLLQKTDSQTTVSKSQSVGMASAVSSVMAVKREECDLIRTLANTHCLLAEVSIHVL